MKGQELEDFIDTLPDIAVYTHVRETVGQECYAISGGPNGEYEILLDTGELVYQGVYVRRYSMEDFKRSLKTGFKGLDVVIVGKGVIHK